MVKVKLFGLFRLDTGLKEINAEASSVKELYPILLSEAKKAKPNTIITAADIDGCVVMINGKQGRKSSKLKDGDEVYLMSPVCGG
ncbi:MAG: MoaD/ThiS family protein [Lachnospiraceae bacterium]|nr:MoaD/ThiS family protein [Lachnospiraceae bacterium]